VEHPNLRIVRKARQESQELPSLESIRRIQRIEVDTERTNSLIDELTSMGTRSFRFIGTGEPFFHRNALEFMGRVKRAGANCSVSTAGHMLDKEKIDELVSMGFDELRVTTLAGTRELYQRTHPGSKDTAFDILKENLLHLAERKAALGLRRPRLHLCLVVISQNHDGLMEFAEFAAHVSADRVDYRPFDDVEDHGLAVMSPTVEEARYAKDQLAGVNSYLESRGIQHNIDLFLKATGTKLDTTALYRVIPCYYGWIGTNVLPSGLVYPCCRGYDPFGNINEQTFSEIWNGEAYRRFRQEAISINKRKTPVTGAECNSCGNFHANFRVYKYLHPIRGRSEEIEKLRPTVLDGSE
jgi:MoaA/NifB/PqqE/SkfB family radical SAM enzyme